MEEQGGCNALELFCDKTGEMHVKADACSLSR